MRLVLVRHGEATANQEGRYLGIRDDPLTARGRAQASQLAQALAALPLAAIYASPLGRAADTAAPIAEAHRLAVQIDQRLREASFGEWEGASRAEVLARDQQHQAWLLAWEGDPYRAPPGGESLAEIQARALALAADLAYAHAGQSIALVSHVGPIKALLCAALGAPLTAAQRMFLDPATISVIDWGDQPIVRLFNAHGHLGWASARWMG